MDPAGLFPLLAETSSPKEAVAAVTGCEAERLACGADEAQAMVRVAARSAADAFMRGDNAGTTVCYAQSMSITDGTYLLRVVVFLSLVSLGLCLFQSSY